ncbi:helix-turn-helix transcriptional regulator [Sphaerisporangium sp. NBC_01403]|uniref:helix-turn-helix domain-containing protein n=1 Tax=Sphaerisporangium sp. NBC_01403 TaxID=2903599 RepID=UPI0032452A4F
MESLEEWLTQPDGLGTRLRALRAQAGLSGKQLADANGWAQSKISRIENGPQIPSPDDIRAWVATCQAEPGMVEDLLRLRDEARVAHATFRSRMRQGQDRVQGSYNDLVKGSRLIRHFETAYVPGLLQVPDYARRVLTEMVTLHDLAIDDVDAAVATRMQRQQMLYDPAKGFEFLLCESVLRWLICTPAVMRAQLDRLQTVIGLERIRFGIVPMGVELATTPQNSFQIYVGEEAIVAVETFIGETFHRDEEADAYGRALDRLWDEAVTGEAARRLIISATQALPTA